MHLIIFAMLFILPQGIANYIVVNEVFYDTPGTDSDEEWIEIYNPTASAIDISNYKVGDAETTPETGEGMYEFPDGTSIGANSYIVVCQYDTSFFRMYGFHADFEFNPSEALVPDMIKYSSWATGNLALSNTGDEVLLLDYLDNVVDVKSVPHNYKFIDSEVKPNTTYYYWLIGLTLSGQRNIMGPVSARARIGSSLAISVNPNPFTQKTVIRYSSIVNSKDSLLKRCSLRIYDVSGRLVRNLSLGTGHSALGTEVMWDGTDDNSKKVSEGVYFIRLKISGKKEVMKKVVLIR